METRVAQSLRHGGAAAGRGPVDAAVFMAGFDPAVDRRRVCGLSAGGGWRCVPAGPLAFSRPAPAPRLRRALPFARPSCRFGVSAHRRPV
eukprot:1371055-Prymnesium_polylepis.1